MSQPVQGPDGKRYQFPDGTTKEQAMEYFRQRGVGGNTAPSGPIPTLDNPDRNIPSVSAVRNPRATESWGGMLKRTVVDPFKQSIAGDRQGGAWDLLRKAVVRAGSGGTYQDWGQKSPVVQATRNLVTEGAEKIKDVIDWSWDKPMGDLTIPISLNPMDPSQTRFVTYSGEDVQRVGQQVVAPIGKEATDYVRDMAQPEATTMMAGFRKIPNRLFHLGTGAYFAVPAAQTSINRGVSAVEKFEQGDVAGGVADTTGAIFQGGTAAEMGKPVVEAAGRGAAKVTYKTLYPMAERMRQTRAAGMLNPVESYTPQQIKEHSEALGMELTPAEITENRTLRAIQGVGEKSTFGGDIIEDKKNENQAKLFTRMQEQGAALSPNTPTTEAAGRKMVEGVGQAEAKSKKAYDKAYADWRETQDSPVSVDLGPVNEHFANRESAQADVLRNVPTQQASTIEGILKKAKDFGVDVKDDMGDTQLDPTMDLEAVRQMRSHWIDYKASLVRKGLRENSQEVAIVNDVIHRLDMAVEQGVGDTAVKNAGQTLTAPEADQVRADAVKAWRDANKLYKEHTQTYHGEDSILAEIRGAGETDMQRVVDNILERGNAGGNQVNIRQLRANGVDLGPLQREVQRRVLEQGFRVNQNRLGGFSDEFLQELYADKPEVLDELYKNSRIGRSLRFDFNPPNSGGTLASRAEVEAAGRAASKLVEGDVPGVGSALLSIVGYPAAKLSTSRWFRNWMTRTPNGPASRWLQKAAGKGPGSGPSGGTGGSPITRPSNLPSTPSDDRGGPKRPDRTLREEDKATDLDKDLMRQMTVARARQILSEPDTSPEDAEIQRNILRHYGEPEFEGETYFQFGANEEGGERGAATGERTVTGLTRGQGRGTMGTDMSTELPDYHGIRESDRRDAGMGANPNDIYEVGRVAKGKRMRQWAEKKANEQKAKASDKLRFGPGAADVRDPSFQYLPEPDYRLFELDNDYPRDNSPANSATALAGYDKITNIVRKGNHPVTISGEIDPDRLFAYDSNETDPEVAREYAERWRNGEVPPPISLTRHQGQISIDDGHHRATAAGMLQRKVPYRMQIADIDPKADNLEDQGILQDLRADMEQGPREPVKFGKYEPEGKGRPGMGPGAMLRKGSALLVRTGPMSGPILYHGTPDSSAESIERVGLDPSTPKAGPRGIYLTTSPDEAATYAVRNRWEPATKNEPGSVIAVDATNRNPQQLYMGEDGPTYWLENRVPPSKLTRHRLEANLKPREDNPNLVSAEISKPVDYGAANKLIQEAAGGAPFAQSSMKPTLPEADTFEQSILKFLLKQPNHEAPTALIHEAADFDTMHILKMMYEWGGLEFPSTDRVRIPDDFDVPGYYDWDPQTMESIPEDVVRQAERLGVPPQQLLREMQDHDQKVAEQQGRTEGKRAYDKLKKSPGRVN